MDLIGGLTRVTLEFQKAKIAHGLIAYSNDKTRVYRDKADIQALFAKHPVLDLEQIKKYADLFGEWNEIQKIKDLK